MKTATIAPSELLRQYDALIDIVPRHVYRAFKPEDLIVQRAKGHELLEILATVGIEVVDIVRDAYDTVNFDLAHGSIKQHVGTGGFDVVARTGAGRLVSIHGPEIHEPGDAMRRYADEAVPEATVGTRVEQREAAERQAVIDKRRAEEDAIVAAYEGLPTEMRDGLKAMIAYLALAERRSNQGFHKMGPPLANMLLWQLQGAEKGLPAFDEKRDGSTFHW